MGLSQSETNKAAEDAAAEEEGKCLAEEASGESEESDEGASAVNMEYILDAETYEANEVTEAGCFLGVWVFLLDWRL